MFRKISVKVAVHVNVVLFLVITFGTILLVNKQSSNLDEKYKEQGKLISVFGAKAVSRLIEEAIDNGVLSVKDAFDTEYSPIPNSDPPKYHTKYDVYMDKALLSLLDEMMKNPDAVYAVAADNNGYVPTHDSKYQKPITGDKEKDRDGNRTKRIFNDSVGLTAAKNVQIGFVQIYTRDTGETMWDVATPIFVKGKQWGNFRLGLSITSLQKVKKDLLLQLTGIMVSILLISTVAIIYTINTILKPLTVLTQIASKMADGDVNEKVIVSSRDEIGDLAEVLERMRISLKSAMERLMKK